MTKKFLYVLDPLASLQVATDTSIALMAEASVNNIENYVCELGDIFLAGHQAGFVCTQVEFSKGLSTLPTICSEPQIKTIDELDVVLMRKDPPVDDKFIAALMMLRCHNPKKTTLLNNPDGLLVANEKLFGLKFASKYFPETLVSSKKEVIKKFVNTQKKVVIKPLFKAGGAGVLVLEAGDLNLDSALELLTASFTEPIVVQSYIKNARGGDKRILLLGGEPLGAVLRVPGSNDHRANFHAGGRAKQSTLTSRELEIVKHIKPHLLACGLHFVGIDVIDGYLTEINVTSPTCLLEMEKYSNANNQGSLRKQILDYILTLIA